MKRIKWSETAANDLQRIGEYIRATNPDSEQATVGSIITRTNVLEAFPRLGRWHETDAADTELRALLISPRYRIIYEVHPDDQVEVMQVVDTRSDHDTYR